MDVEDNPKKDHTGIQADKPTSFPMPADDILGENSFPPWERPGYFRLDGEPHRGNFLWWLACASAVCGILAMMPCWGWIPGVLGIPFGLGSYHLARGDLAKMRAGLMDPNGQVITSDAMKMGRLGFLFSAAGAVIWGAVLLLVIWAVP